MGPNFQWYPETTPPRRKRTVVKKVVGIVAEAPLGDIEVEDVFSKKKKKGNKRRVGPRAHWCKQMLAHY